MFADVFSGDPQGSAGELGSTNHEPLITSSAGVAGWAKVVSFMCWDGGIWA